MGTAIMMRHHFLLLTLAVSFCAALPTAGLVVPERKVVDFVAYSTSASFIQAMSKSGGTEADCRTFATTTIHHQGEHRGHAKNPGCRRHRSRMPLEGQEEVASTQITVNKAKGDPDNKKGAAATALSAMKTACSTSVAFEVNLDTLQEKECYPYKQESTYINADNACTSATAASTKADLAEDNAKIAVANGQQANEAAVKQAAQLMSSCHCRVQAEQAAAWKAASGSKEANAADWKQAHEVLCTLDKTTTSESTNDEDEASDEAAITDMMLQSGCDYDACPTVSQPTVASGVAEEDCSEESNVPTVLTPAQPPDMCKCTGNSNEYECTGNSDEWKAHCATGQVCDGIDEVKFENLRQIESAICDVNMCKCTGNSNEYECTVTGKGHCAVSEKCDGLVTIENGRNVKSTVVTSDQIASHLCFDKE